MTDSTFVRKGAGIMFEKERLMARHSVELREEFEDWAVLLDHDSGDAFGLNPMGVLIWKCIDGRRTPQDILAELKENHADVPEDAEDQLNEFIHLLVEQELVSFGD